MEQRFGISEAAHKALCSEGTLRRLDAEGVVTPTRDPWGRRLFSQADVEAVKAHLARKRLSRSAA
jgi:DNA-binding transcriptional MerR regulator